MLWRRACCCGGVLTPSCVHRLSSSPITPPTSQLQGFAAHGIPLDSLSVDMDWHHTYPHGLQNPHGVQIEGGCIRATYDDSGRWGREFASAA